jgi:hypothetical protein
VQVWRERANLPKRQAVEAIGIGIVVVAVAALSFEGKLPTVYLTLPALLWAAVRFRLRGAAAAMGLLTLVTAFFTVSGRGEFVGDPASMHERIVMLQMFLGVSAISAFLVAALSSERQEALQNLEALNAQLLGISVDGMWCHQAYAEARKLKFPLLSDFHPKGATARDYGAYNAEWGVAVRALFVIDDEGLIRWSYLSPIDVNPGAEGILAALEQINGKATAER